MTVRLVDSIIRFIRNGSRNTKIEIEITGISTEKRESPGDGIAGVCEKIQNIGLDTKVQRVGKLVAIATRHQPNSHYYFFLISGRFRV